MANKILRDIRRACIAGLVGSAFLVSYLHQPKIMPYIPEPEKTSQTHPYFESEKTRKVIYVDKQGKETERYETPLMDFNITTKPSLETNTSTNITTKPTTLEGELK